MEEKQDLIIDASILKKKQRYGIRWGCGCLSFPLIILIGLINLSASQEYMGIYVLPFALFFFPTFYIGNNQLTCFLFGKPLFDNALFMLPLIYIIIPASYFFWFYLIGMNIDLFLKKIKWEQAKKFVIVQILILFPMLMDYSLFSKDWFIKNIKNALTFSDYDYWIAAWGNVFYLMFLIFTFVHYSRIEKKAYSLT